MGGWTSIESGNAAQLEPTSAKIHKQKHVSSTAQATELTSLRTLSCMPRHYSVIYIQFLFTLPQQGGSMCIIIIKRAMVCCGYN